MSGTDQGAALSLNTITMDHPWTWLEKGWTDLRRAPVASLSFGVLFVALGYGITAGLWAAGLSAMTPAAAAGFALMAPLLAVGLYEISRRLETGEPISLGSIYFVKTAAPGQLAFICVILMLLFLAWARIAGLLFALFIQGDYMPLEEFTSYLLTTVDGLTLLVTGSVIGAAIGFAVFTLSAISIPILVRNDVDVFTAIALSIKAVRDNTKPMLLWAWFIAMAIGISMLTLFLGLIVLFPVLGHATWHAYRSLVNEG